MAKKPQFGMGGAGGRGETIGAGPGNAPQASQTQQTFAPQTNFGDEPQGQQAWDPSKRDVNAPPPGIPESYWAALKQGGTDTGEWFALLSKNTGKPGSTKLDGGMTVQQLYDDLIRIANERFSALPEGAKNEFRAADQEQNPYDPFSPEGQRWQDQKDAERVRGETVADYEEWESKYLPGLQQAMEEASRGDAAAVGRFQALLDGIQDPELAEYVGDYVSQAAEARASQEAINRQRGQFEKYQQLSDPTITAEERLMMEMSRRQQEADLKAQRGAFANDLQARGVYGSGAELTMNLAASQEAAQRRAFEHMQALANAQGRAMDALGKASELSTTIRDTEFDEASKRGTAADKAAEFNKKLRESYNTWKANEQRKTNDERIKRGEARMGATLSLGDRDVGRAGTAAELGLKGTSLKSGQYSGSSNPIYDIGRDIAVERDNDETETKMATMY